MCWMVRNPPPLGSVILWCMMYAQKGNLMFIHDFQGNASAKPSDFLLRNKTTWDWDFSLKAHRPSCSTPLSVSLPLHPSLSRTFSSQLAFLKSLLNSPSIFFLPDLIYLTLGKKDHMQLFPSDFARLSPHLASVLCWRLEWRDEFGSFF